MPSVSGLKRTVHTKKYVRSSRFVVFCCGLAPDNFIHILKGYITVTDHKVFSNASNP